MRNRHSTLVCYGDSITQGFDIPANCHWPAVLASMLQKANSPITRIFSRGVGGNTAALGMDRISTDLGPLLPAVVLLEFGINDAYVNPWASQPRSNLANYLAHMEDMVLFVRRSGGEPVFLINHPLVAYTDKHQQGNGKTIVENILPYSAALGELALRLHVPLLDLPSELGEDFLAALHADGIHLTPESSVLYGQAVFQLISSL